MPRFDDPDLARIPEPADVDEALGGYFPGGKEVVAEVRRRIGDRSDDEVEREIQEQERDYVDVNTA